MNKQTKILITVLIISIITLNLISAMTVNSVDANNFQQGEEQEITIKIKNSLDKDASSVSLTLDMSKLPFSVISSEDDSTEIDEDDTEGFDFTIKASNDAKAGDYSIPYTLTYSIDETQQTPKTGTFTLTVEADPELVYSLSVENPIVGSQGKIKLKIVNKGFGDAKFVDVEILSDGYTLLSEAENYIGTVSSDDSETVDIDVVFKKQNPTLNAQIEYRDFNNEKITKNINLPVTVYSKEQALQMGIIKPNNTPYYIVAGIIIFAGWMIIRRIRKKRRMNKAQGR